MGSGKCRVLLGGKNSMDGDKRREKILEDTPVPNHLRERIFLNFLMLAVRS